jgi:hypothetical protein
MDAVLKTPRGAKAEGSPGPRSNVLVGTAEGSLILRRLIVLLSKQGLRGPPYCQTEELSVA